MTTWSQIFPGAEHPVRGSMTEFAGARDAFDNMETDAQNVVDQFANFADPGFVDGHLNNEPGEMVTRLLSNTADGLGDLPRVAREAKGIFSDHHSALDGFYDRADQALARAKTAWDRKNELLSDQSSLSSQITGLNNDIDNAAPDADTTTLDSDLSGAQSSLTGVNGELESVQSTLDGIYGNDDSEWNGIRNDENSRNDTTIEALDNIDLGDLEDPGFWDKVGDFLEGVLDFLGGILETVGRLIEAIASGDLAGVLWELKGLLDVALLVLGTIALFTGIGAPLGALMIGLAVASFAITAGLYLTETPNPQTGQTMSLLDVGVSAVGVVFSGAGLLRIAKSTTAINQAARGIPRLQTTFGAQFKAANAFGFRNGALPGLFKNTGHLTANGITRVANASGRYGRLPMPFPVGSPQVTQVVDDFSGLVTGLKAPTQQGLLATAWSARGVTGSIQNFTPFSLPGEFHRVTGSKGSEPLVSPAPPPRAHVLKVGQQLRQSPDINIIPATP